VASAVDVSMSAAAVVLWLWHIGMYAGAFSGVRALRCGLQWLAVLLDKYKWSRKRGLMLAAAPAATKAVRKRLRPPRACKWHSAPWHGTHTCPEVAQSGTYQHGNEAGVISDCRSDRSSN